MRPNLSPVLVAVVAMLLTFLPTLAFAQDAGTTGPAPGQDLTHWVVTVLVGALAYYIRNNAKTNQDRGEDFRAIREQIAEATRALLAQGDEIRAITETLQAHMADTQVHICDPQVGLRAVPPHPEVK